jgi:hypothetical protein
LGGVIASPGRHVRGVTSHAKSCEKEGRQKGREEEGEEGVEEEGEEIAFRRSPRDKRGVHGGSLREKPMTKAKAATTI